MTPFDEKFIENPQFLKWVFNTNPAIEQYWKQYIIENSEEKIQLQKLKKQLAELNFSNEILTLLEKDELAKQIAKRANLEIINKKYRLMLRSFLRYAAVALIFAAVGGLLVYLNMDKELFYQLPANQMVQIPATNQEPFLITSNGENVGLKKSSSTVDYSRNGSVVLNNDSVLTTLNDVPSVLNQLVIPYGNQSRVVLSDMTVVWLNAGSRLVYPTLFKDKTREVFLFGEAYFEVAKNPDKPFIVKTSNLDIEVLGTQFNVSSYPEDNIIQTVLKEGSVAIRQKGATIFEKDIIIHPNQLASFNKTNNNTEIYKVDTDYYTMWTKGLISFEETDLVRITKRLERFYNISINFADPHLQIMRISGKLDLKKSQKEVMEYLEKVSLSKFEQINNNQYVIK